MSAPSLTVALSGLAILSVCAQPIEQPVRAVTDPGVITTRQNITPAGVQSIFHGRVFGLTFGASSSEIWVLASEQVLHLDWQRNRVLHRFSFKGTSGLQGIAYDPVDNRVFVTAAGKGDNPRVPEVQLFSIQNGEWKLAVRGLGTYIAGALDLAAKPDASNRRIAVVPLVRDNQAAVIDLAVNRLLARVDTEKAPFGAVLNSTGTVAYITNWGGRMPSISDLTAPTGLQPDSDRVVVDERGIASTGTVSRIDLLSGAVTHQVPAGLHPTAIVWDQSHNRLYVSNGNEDSVSVIDTLRQLVVRTISLQAFPQKVKGISPTALAISADGGRLYVACGSLNAIAVIDTANGTIEGSIPTAWYPNDLSLSTDGKYLAVSTLLGVGSGWRDEPRKRYVHEYRGSVSVIPIPNAGQLASYTTAVAENNHLTLSGHQPTTAVERKPTAIPQRSGEPSLIKHVVYVIKENRTYDQVFGDIEKGNGDPSLVMFGKSVTPNQHELAEQFVLFDNFYANGGDSGDGHQWLTQANETDYVLWPGYVGRSYPFDGTDPIAYASGGFIWDAALRAGKTVRVFGEFAARLNESSEKQRSELLERWRKGDDFTRDWSIEAPLKPLNTILAKNYPSYSTAIPDVVRAQIFIAELRKWEKADQMPNLVILQLPSNHTRGTSPGASTPKAMIADNDLALGQIVEALTKTPFWEKMAIFVVEDDAQNGVDHVDGHRTVALVVSPYARRRYVDSTFYAQTSMLKTIELILGLPSLSLFDLIANPMTASFVNEPDSSGYVALMPDQSLFETNPSLDSLRGAARKAALDSLAMRFDVPDAAPSDRLNRILWHNARGWKTSYPGIKQAIFAPLSLDIEDDER